MKKKDFHICCVGYKSYNDIEWICHTCRTAVLEYRIPKLSIYNKLGFPPQPPELKLYPIEEQLVVLCLPVMQIKNSQCGGQTLVHGNIVNVPVNIAPTVNILPRHMKDTDTIIIKFKQKKYKCYEYQENVHPVAVWKAAKYLLANSELYDEANM